MTTLLRNTVLTAAFLIILSPTPSLSAARGIDPAPPMDEFNWQLTASLTLRVQKSLTEAGLYSGPLDGRMGPETMAAIRAYQRSAGVPAEGRLTPDLADKIDMWVRVDQLRKRLEKVSRERKATARQALLSTPETRDLLTDTPTETADPTHDSAPCLNTPTVSCLLNEAKESTKSIHKANMRDWALGELLTAQAEAGYADRAIEATKRISDPRLILVALRDIADAHARAGRSALALRAAEIIPDPARQREALTAIAETLASQGNAGAAQAIDHLRRHLQKLEAREEKVAVLSGMAVALTLSGRREDATAHIRQAESLARAGSGLRRVAESLAKMDRPGDALRIIRDIGSKSDRMAALMAVVKSYVRAGRAEDALSAAKSITEPRYRAVALSLAARALAQSEKTEQAIQALKPARQAAEATTSPYARAYAFSRVAIAQAPVQFQAALDSSAKVENMQLRAATLWAITLQQTEEGHTDNANRAQALARIATRDVGNGLTQVWLWSDLALNQHKAGNPARARSAFVQARNAARKIKDLWRKSRAFARLAKVLYRITDGK